MALSVDDAKKPKASKLGINLGDPQDDEDDAEIAESFLNVNRNIVKTAHEPKPPKDYVDSSKNVLAAAANQQNPDKKPQLVAKQISVKTGAVPKK
mmetsp:Transcript_56142/g.93572  ORF Transcript_56142/g.93572 Transcript_56142/m.93572 type:complete len:95 (+) Transcript_56142:100-384(+)|eukprot:CAMPEP_0202690736 /NCGR_PEP_ID=MMETSP1385-20130828/5640_1 /ASSEMBLY_ACC=CAM_ASM_000861 /TAXON_ID=933848 /ORGANISM="Elphidium margaritaceum" /LENGTH=94 /DNA_ID=CAMNT_0049346027 /DNA_START=94 /DNA_END=378 /DNA_ORIENTATION=-